MVHANLSGKSLAHAIPASSLPHLLCPHCGNASVSLADEVALREAPASRRAQSHEDWDPSWVHGTFHALLKCQHAKCLGEVDVVGTYKLDYEDGTYDGPSWEEYLRVQYVSPTLTLFALPEKTPEDVSAHVKAAERVWLASPDAAANELRRAVESVMADHGIPGQSSNGGFISLDTRIQKYKVGPDPRPMVGDLFLAVKWLGNDASHSGTELTHDELLKGGAILTHALDLIYQDFPATAQQINRAKGAAGLR